MSEKAVQSIDRVPQAERELSAITLRLSAGGFKAIKQRIQAFQHELIELSEAETAPDHVVQLNFHCFPLTSVEL
jgi:uncharacterized protein (TIGR02147 family)